jgi:CheY-like chemotaxis protein
MIPSIFSLRPHTPDMSNMRQRILVVDDNGELQNLVRTALEHEGYDLLTAYNAVQGSELSQARLLITSRL